MPNDTPEIGDSGSGPRTNPSKYGEALADSPGGLGLGLTKRQQVLLLAAVVVAAVVAWRMYDGDQSASSGASTDALSDEFEAELAEELDAEVEVHDEDGDGEVEITVPHNPDDELAKDRAVLEGLKQSGKFQGAGDE